MIRTEFLAEGRVHVKLAAAAQQVLVFGVERHGIGIAVGPGLRDDLGQVGIGLVGQQLGMLVDDGVLGFVP